MVMAAGNKIVIMMAALTLSACAPKVVSRLPMSKVGRYVRDMLRDPDQARANWGILAVNLRTGKTLIDYNSGKHFVPASNTKLYTTAAALKLLGPEFRYRTPILTTGKIVGGILKGDLVVVGVGDPSWSKRMREDDGTTVFVGWADSLRAHGITAIAGDIVGVDGVYDGVRFGSGWMWDDQPYWYSAPISALSFNENVVDIIFVPNPGKSPEMLLNPVTSYVTILNNLTTLDTLNNPDSLESDWDSWRDAGSNVTRFDGLSPPDTLETAATVDDPMAFTATVLKEVLQSAGISVNGTARGASRHKAGREPLNISGDTLFVFPSPTLGEIIYYLNKDSQNLMAEVLLRTVASGAEKGASAEAGLEIFKPVWSEMGVDTNSIHLVDGSGVSHYNKVTPANTVALLTAMQGDTTYFRSLPIAGVDGTLENEMLMSPAEGRVFAKTGTLTHARTLSGYLIQAGGDTVAFSIMANAYLTGNEAVNTHIYRICELLVMQ